MALSEFALIERYFTPPRFPAPASGSGVVLGVGDDCAILRMPPGDELLVSVDTLIAGVHFPGDTPPAAIGHRALAVNLSDLAAMGAAPLWFTLALTLPEARADWLEEFSAGLAALARSARIALVGGDTTRGPLSITVQVHGSAPAGTALRRSGARSGDDLWVSGTPGAAALGLRALQGGSSAPPSALRAFLHPEPRLALGQGLRGLATAAIDVSDGLLADAGHIAAQSGVRIEIDAQALPLGSLRAAGLAEDDARALCLSGGDDYELCFSTPPGAREAIAALAGATGVPCTRIGTIGEGSGAHCAGWSGPHGYLHFGA